MEPFIGVVPRRLATADLAPGRDDDERETALRQLIPLLRGRAAPARAGIWMSESCCLQWSQAINERLTGVPICQLCQIAAARANSRAATRAEPLGLQLPRAEAQDLEARGRSPLHVMAGQRLPGDVSGPSGQPRTAAAGTQRLGSALPGEARRRVPMERQGDDDSDCR